MLNERDLDDLKFQVLRGQPIIEPHKHFLAVLIEQHKQAVLANEFYLTRAHPDGPVVEAPVNPLAPPATDIPHSDR